MISNPMQFLESFQQIVADPDFQTKMAKTAVAYVYLWLRWYRRFLLHYRPDNHYAKVIFKAFFSDTPDKFTEDDGSLAFLNNLFHADHDLAEMFGASVNTDDQGWEATLLDILGWVLVDDAQSVQKFIMFCYQDHSPGTQIEEVVALMNTKPRLAQAIGTIGGEEKAKAFLSGLKSVTDQLMLQCDSGWTDEYGPAVHFARQGLDWVLRQDPSTEPVLANWFCGLEVAFRTPLITLALEAYLENTHIWDDFPDIVKQADLSVLYNMFNMFN